MTDQQQTTATTAPAVPSGPTPVRNELVEAYRNMLADVPDAGEGEGMERILAQIAAATDVSEVDAPWRSSDFEQLADLVIQVRGISKAPSEYAGGLPWFLIVDAVIEETGEAVTATTGAVSIVAQLTKIWSLGGFPIRARVKVSERPTKSGFYPQHLEFLTRRQAAGNGNGGGA